MRLEDFYRAVFGTEPSYAAKTIMGMEERSILERASSRHAATQTIRMSLHARDRWSSQRADLIIVDDPFCGLSEGLMPLTAGDADRIVAKQGTIYQETTK